MDLSKFIYLVTLFLSLVYFLFRKISFYSLAFFSTVAFSFPVLFIKFVEFEVIFIYSLILLLLVMADVLFKSNLSKCDFSKIYHNKSFVEITFFILFIIFLIELYTTNYFTALGKQDLEVSFAYYLRSGLLSIVNLLSYIKRKKIIFISTVFLYIFTLITGDRTQIVIQIINLSLYVLSKEKKSVAVLLFKRKFTFFMLIILLFFLVISGKIIYGTYFDYLAGKNLFFSFKERSILAISDFSNSYEGFHTIDIINNVTKYDDRIDKEYLLFLPANFIPFSYKSIKYNSHFIPNYLKDNYYGNWSEKSGVSANFFAEGYLVSGFIGSVTFVFIYVMVLKLFDTMLLYKSKFIRLFAYLFGIYWAFYIHRSSLFQMIAHFKRIFLVLILISILWYCKLILFEIIFSKKNYFNNKLSNKHRGMKCLEKF